MRLLVSALEPSANLHLTSLCAKLPSDVELVGVFDKNLGTPIVDLSQNAVMGFVDVIAKIPFFLKLKNEMVSLSFSCDKVLLMDSSGFNLPLAQAIKKANPTIQIIYYILPQAWVWKKNRVYKLDKYCDSLCSIIPFERDIYPNPQKVKYVGHPLLDQITSMKTKVVATKKIVFMPGSRRHEIGSLLPIFKQMCENFDGYEKILVIPSKFSDSYIQEIYGDIEIFTIMKNTHEALMNAEYAFVCSGTATLEAALLATPFTLCYKAKKIDFFLGKLFVKLNFVGLANIFFEKMGKEKLHDELLQEDVTKENLLTSYYQTNQEKFIDNCMLLREYLEHGSADTMAKIITEGNHK